MRDGRVFPRDWCHTVLNDVQQRPANLAAAGNRSADTAAITRLELEQLASSYLNPSRGFLYFAVPASPLFWDRK